MGAWVLINETWYQSMLLPSMILRIMVTHGFRSQKKMQL